jgi:tetratricopeptide (TPR) repeat protein
MQSSFFRAIVFLCCFVFSGSAAEVHSTPAAAQALFAEAQSSLARGSMDAAYIAVQKGLAIAPRSIEGLNLLGIMDDQQQRYPEGESAFQKALEIDPRSTKTHDNLGIHYLLRGAPDLAEHEFRATLRLSPNDASANYNLGKLLLDKGDAEGAVTCLERITPQDINISFTLVKSYLRANHPAKAFALARTLSGKSAGDPRVHFSLGVELAAAREYRAAVHEFELADKLMPGTFEILHNWGEAQLRSGEHAEAERTLQEALALRSDSAATTFLLAQSQAEQYKKVEALDLLLRARKLDPGNPDVLFLIAQISMGESLYEDAVSLLDQAIKLAPGRPDLHAALGDSYLGLEKTEQAIHEFKTVIDLQPSAASYAFMADAYMRTGDLQNAKKYLAQGIAKDARNSPCLYEQGIIAEKEGNNADAELLLTSAVKVDPSNDNALYRLATIKMRRRKYEEAIPLLRRCTHLMPNMPRVYYRLATAERNLHDTAAAAADMRTFQTLSRSGQNERLPIQDTISGITRFAERSRAGNENIRIKDLEQRVLSDPGNPFYSYLLVEAYLKTGDAESARRAVAKIAEVGQGEYGRALSIGKLLAKYRLYPEAVQQLEVALKINANSDDAKYELACAYFAARDYTYALNMIQQASPATRQSDKWLALSGNTLARMGHTTEAVQALQQAVAQNPTSNQNVLFLALAQLQADSISAAEKTLRTGLTHNPDSGLLHWGEGIMYVMASSSAEAEKSFEAALELLPDWQGAYATLVSFYSFTGQPAKAREMQARFHQLFAEKDPDPERLKQDVRQTPLLGSQAQLSQAAREKFLHLALSKADQL